MGLFDFLNRNKPQADEKLASSLASTKKSFLGRLNSLVLGKGSLSEELLDELEELLLLSDVGVETTVKMIDRIRKRVARERYTNPAELNRLLRDEVTQIFRESGALENPGRFDAPIPTQNGQKVPFVILVVGVNGVGKTTTIGKLAHQFGQAGLKVVLGAADTFRAAAVDQLKVWGQRSNALVVNKGMDVDPAAVAFDAVQEGLKQAADVVIVDTAGRLHNKKGLMEQLGKIKRVMGRAIADAPHEVLLVLDASTGQNALQQAEEFTAVTQVTAIALTKLDGTAKGGVVLGIADRFRIPVRYVGVGEGLNDLQVFDPSVYVNSLFEPLAEA